MMNELLFVGVCLFMIGVFVGVMSMIGLITLLCGRLRL